MKGRPKILVVGSLVMDLTISTPHFPEQGETVLGQTFQTAPGGKGANQAMQAALLGAEVTMVGTVGKDAFGAALIASLRQAGVDVSNVRKTDAAATAVGNILLTTQDGMTLNNRIIVVPGANMEIEPKDIAYLEHEIGAYDMVLLQLEIPMAVNEAVSAWAAAGGIPVMLNPAPYTPVDDTLLKNITYISPNEYEAAGLSGKLIQRTEAGISQEPLRAAISAIHKRGVQQVIVTLGDNGSVLSACGEITSYPCVKDIRVADPTAAGDSFVGAFCTGHCVGLSDRQAMAFATYAAGMTVSRPGAQPSLPNLKEVLAFMRERNFNTFDLSLLDQLQ
jgi:ribokinase